MAPVEPTHPYISSTEASKRYGITGDHVGLLCRRGKVRAVLVGRMWFVEEDSLTEYLDAVKKKREERHTQLSKEFSKTWATLALLCVMLLPSQADAHTGANLFTSIIESAVVRVERLVSAMPQLSQSQPLFAKVSPRESKLVLRLPDIALTHVANAGQKGRLAAAVSLSPVASFFCNLLAIECAPADTDAADTLEKTHAAYTVSVQPSAAEYVAAVQARSPLADQVLYTATFDPGAFVTFAFLEEQVRRIYDSIGDGLRGVQDNSTDSTSSGSSLALADATGTLAIGKGGTGLTTTPSYGQLLMGTADGAFSLVATSSLGITGSSSFWDSASTGGIYYNGSKVGIGTTTPTRTKVQIVAPSNGDPALMLTNMDADINKKHRWITTSDGGSIQFGQSDDDLGYSSVQFVMDTNGRLGIGTTTPGTLLSIGGDGFNEGINISDTATSTFGYGLNILTGCFAVNGVCITGGSNGSVSQSFSYPFPNNATTTGLGIFASSTIGGGAQATGLTINGGATTTGFLKVLSTATSTFSGGLQALVLNVSGTTASSTFANGINLSGGCFAINGTCLSSGGASSLTGTVGQIAYFSGTNTAVGTSSLYIAANGNVGIGTTSPYARLSVVGEVVARNFTATSTTATSTFAGGINVGSGALVYDYSGGLTTIQNLAFGSMNFETDSGIISWVDMPVTSSASAGTVESYTAFIDGANVLTVYGESNGLGGVQNLRVGVGTTSPYATLAVQASAAQAYPVFEVASSSVATKFLTVSGTGFGTTTLSGLSISGSATSTSNVGFNLTGGCFAINGTCVGGGSSLTGSAGQVAYFSGTNTAIGTSSIYVHSTGRVGIGTTTPNYQFAVSAAFAPYIQIHNSGSTNKYAALVFSAQGQDQFELRVDRQGNGTRNFMIWDRQTAATPFFIDPDSNVGIGTSTPASKFTVDGTGLFSTTDARPLILHRQTLGSNVSMEFRNNTASWFAGQGSTGDFNLDTDDNVGAASKLALTTGGALTVASCTGCSSDRRLKTNIEDLSQDDVFEKLLALRPVSFNWAGPVFGVEMSSSTQFGFIAQEAEEVFPELVLHDRETDATPGGTYLFNYQGLISPLVVAVQELYKLVMEVKERIAGWGDKFTTKELCVGSVCVTEDQFLAMVQAAGQQPSREENPLSDPEPDPEVPADTPSEQPETVVPEETPDTIEEEPAAVTELEETTSETEESDSPEEAAEPVALETE